MHETTVRFTDELWARVQQASRREGTSAAQFVREATVARIAVEMHLRPLRSELDAELDKLDDRVRQLEDVLRRHGLR
ncbi:MAG: hypothetical protein WBC33_12005 [Conexibacter sp.]